jgi:hypothetical protein
MCDVPRNGVVRNLCGWFAHSNSHVIPAFVYRWLKETSATGYLRTAIKPNVRVQDGPRRYWFCRRCEDTMGRHERAFSDSLFPSIVSGAPAPYPHGPWLSRFLASVVLRVAMLHAEHPGVFDLATSAQRAVVPQAGTVAHVRAW